ncbi:MAG: helix-turn-helix domain-containing protein [Kofleriaceae bacterium]
MARKQPRHERSGAIVDALLRAVEELLEQHGPTALSTNRIAERAGVSVGTLYQYYPHASQRQISRWLVEMRTAAGVHQRLHDELDQLTAELARFLAARDDLRLSDPGATASLLVHMGDGLVNGIAMRAGQLSSRRSSAKSPAFSTSIWSRAPSARTARLRRARTFLSGV